MIDVSELIERVAAEVAVTVCRDVAELPDRTSPSDWPEAMLVTADELQLIVAREVSAAIEASGVQSLSERVAVLEDERRFVWKWVERGLFDKELSMAECLSVMAGYPGAPWMNGRWDVDHKPYASAFYKRFPRAALTKEGIENG